MRLLLLAILVVPVIENADSESWMKKENPDELGLGVDVLETCPFTEAEITSIVEGEFLRTRVKTTEMVSADLYLAVDVVCYVLSVSDRRPSRWAMAANNTFWYLDRSWWRGGSGPILPRIAFPKGIAQTIVGSFCC